MNTQEIWKPIDNFIGLYEISDLGRVRSFHKNSMSGSIKAPYHSNGYLQVNLYKHGKLTHASPHRLVALAFIPNPDNKSDVNHKNGIRDDNRVSNLEWMTKSENHNHSYRELGRKAAAGESHGMRKLCAADVIKIRELYKGGAGSYRAIGKIYNVSEATIRHILSGETWGTV